MISETNAVLSDGDSLPPSPLPRETQMNKNNKKGAANEKQIHFHSGSNAYKKILLS